MKIAVVGNNGYIGKYLIGIFSKMEKVDRILKIGRNSEADYFLELEKAEQFEYAVLEQIDYVIFTSAVSSPDKCAKEYDYCWNINVTGTGCLIERALHMGCKVLFFSSDAVYGDMSGTVCSEQSETKAETPYGKMKKAIEDKFCDNPSFKALRLSYVVSAEDKFMIYLLNCMDHKEKAEVFHPFYRNCIMRSDAADIVIWLLEHWEVFPHTFVNAAGEELVSRVRMADELNRLAAGRLDYAIIRPEQDFYKNRPVFTQMKSLYLYDYNMIKRGSFTEKFQREMRE